MELEPLKHNKMKNILIFGFALFIVQSCVFIRTDDSIDLGSKFRYIQDYPQAIIFHRAPEYKGSGVNIVPPNVIDYKFDNIYIIAKSKDLEDKKMKYWIIDKRMLDKKGIALDSLTFFSQLEEKKINLKF